MLVVDVMTTDVKTVKWDTPVLDALKIMLENNFRRLPVLDEDDRPVGMVSQRAIEELKPHGGFPMIWQIGPWAVHHTVAEVMNKKLVTIHPTDTVEFATAKAQSAKVGSLIVVENNKIVGMVTTNDIFYKVVNPTLGIGEAGSRVVVIGGGEGEHATRIIEAINKLGIQIKVIWAIFSSTNKKNNLVLHLETEDARKVVGDLASLGYEARQVRR
jgi:acetoin utilization protein AcuB